MSQSVVGPDARDEDTGPVTIYDIQAAEDSKVRVRALPRLTRQALRIAWAAGRREFLLSTLLQIIGAAAARCSCSWDNKASKHSWMQSKAVNHSPRLHHALSQSPVLQESSHSSLPCRENVKKSLVK